MSRARRIEDAAELVARSMNLRPPQVEALKELRDALLRLPRPLGECSPDERRDFLALRDGMIHANHPAFTIALATGVGKTRLAGAIMALLWLTGEARTFLILAPRRAVLRRFNDALDPRFREYIFVNPSLVPEPQVVRADEVESPTAIGTIKDLFARGPRIYLLSPQLISTSDRFKGRGEFAGRSLSEALQEVRDLVVIADEAHHIGGVSQAAASAWASAIRQLCPALQLGLTATPRNEAGESILYEYPLRRALSEGRYTKAVQIRVRQFPEGRLDPSDIDRATIDFALQRLERKRHAIEEAPESFPPTKPVAVLFARDIAHAEEVAKWIVDTERLEREEVLLTHSKMSKSEEELEKLLNIEKPDNKIRLVVNVMELTEGWDVTNVYVVAPLRAMATFAGALQAIGRGLRLPAGRRVGVPELDDLDVICFGKQSLEEIITEATDWSGQLLEHTSVSVKSHDAPEQSTELLTVEAEEEVKLPFRELSLIHSEISLSLAPEALENVKRAVVAGLELAAARTRISGSQEQARLERGRFVKAAAMRVIRSMPQYLSDHKHAKDVTKIVEDWLDVVAKDQRLVPFDPDEVGDEIQKQLLRGAKQRAANYADSGRTQLVEFGSYQVTVEDNRIQKSGNNDFIKLNVDDFVIRRFYGQWEKNLHAVSCFDSYPEAKLAKMLDQAAEVKRWIRNQPRRLKIPTPAGDYHPDFVVHLHAADQGDDNLLLVEVKADDYWDPTDSEARLKAAAAAEWCRVQSSAGYQVEIRVALETDIKRASSWSEVLEAAKKPGRKAG